MSDQAFESEYDKVGDFYFDFVHRGDPRKTHIVESLLRMLGDVEGLKICDLACGEGFFSRLLAEQGAVVTGIDISSNLLAHARRQSESLPITYVRDDVQFLRTVEDGSFDIVLCHMALMDITDLKATFDSVYRVLRHQGRFLFGLLHPCFETPFNARNPPNEYDAEGNFLCRRINTYADEGKWFSDGSGMRGTLGSIHRQLSTYVNGLVQAGLVIQQMEEPLLPPGDYEDPGQQAASKVPGYLVVETTRASEI